jgi:hypothetical protein
MGAVGVLVPPPVFKTEREARRVSGGFDSHPFPPETAVNARKISVYGRFSLVRTNVQERGDTLGLYPSFSEYEGVTLYRVRRCHYA